MINSAKLLVALPSFCVVGYFGISGTLRYSGGGSVDFSSLVF